MVNLYFQYTAVGAFDYTNISEKIMWLLKKAFTRVFGHNLMLDFLCSAHLICYYNVTIQKTTPKRSSKKLQSYKDTHHKALTAINYEQYNHHKTTP